MIVLRRVDEETTSGSGSDGPTMLSKNGPDLELEVLDPIAHFLVHRDAIAEFQRAHRRIPGDAGAYGKAERLELWLKTVVINLACVRKHRQAHRLVARLDEIGLWT